MRCVESLAQHHLYSLNALDKTNTKRNGVYSLFKIAYRSLSGFNIPNTAFVNLICNICPFNSYRLNGDITCFILFAQVSYCYFVKGLHSYSKYCGNVQYWGTSIPCWVRIWQVWRIWFIKNNKLDLEQYGEIGVFGLAYPNAFSGTNRREESKFDKWNPND